MPTTSQRQQDSDDPRQDQAKLNRLIAERVLHTLGEPGGLQQVQVRRLWEEHYRVNVLVGEDFASAKVAHSYFLATDRDGNIVTSTPKLAKRY
jgi:hypothetical protein